ncbi:MAG TPA: cytochrome c [Actinomycetota bacterium]
MLAASSTAGIILLALGGALVLTAGVALYLRGRSKEQAPDIPEAMRPGPADAALETPLLQKLQGWGVVLVAFLVVWMPYTWLREPSENLKQDEELKTAAVSRGGRAVHLFSEENQLGVGCVRCHGPELRGGVIQVGADYDYPPNLTNICAGPFGDPPHPAIYSTADIYQVLEEGRGNMPSWSIRYQGALDDQQINDLVNYLVAMSSENVPFEDNVCLNPDASERALEENLTSSPREP